MMLRKSCDDVCIIRSQRSRRPKKQENTMKRKVRFQISLAILSAWSAAACTPAKQSSIDVPATATANDGNTTNEVGTDLRSTQGILLPASRNGLPAMIVHKSASCGCCGAWVEHMRADGFTVEVRDADNLEPVKSRLGVPFVKGSCHTAEVDGYFIEGHVPAADIRRLLSERPDALGLALPGMPIGSPGMESPDGRRQAYTVELVSRDGATQAFSQHPATD
jgi:hypothetical protein